jgi:hypothetical protein
MSFIDKILPAPPNGGFQMPGYWVWCGSVVQGGDGHYHMFASRWPNKKRESMAQWLFNSEIVRATSSTPEGPYVFQEIVFHRRDRHFFDGLNTHNPSIKKWRDTYYLFYIGVTYEGPIPVPGEAIPQERFEAVWLNKRIGLATSKSVLGPWQRQTTPLLKPRRDKWDQTITSNPSAAILDDGRTYLIYKSRQGGTGNTLQLGIAFAPHPEGPYERLSNLPIFSFPNSDFHVEDAFLWHENGMFHLIMKDDFKNGCGGITGEWGAGVYATSSDAVHWKIADHPKAYSRTVLWDDGTTTTMAHLERPNLLIQNGTPTHLFCAAAEGPAPWNFKASRNICIPLKY